MFILKSDMAADPQKIRRYGTVAVLASVCCVLIGGCS